jgi:hypothetical protein
MYLLEDTPDAAAMRQNVCDMLYSHDESNALLACQLIEGGGFHGDFLGLVAAYVIEEYWQGAEEKPFHALLKKNISPSKMTALRKLYGMHYAWDNLVGYLEAMTWIKQKKAGASWAKHWKEWALIAFRWQQYCSIICLKHALVSADELFQSLVYHYGGQHSLYLNGYDLEDLPEIFATLEVTHINFTDNPFHKIKRKKWQNPHVVTLYLDHNTYTARFWAMLSYFYQKCTQRQTKGFAKYKFFKNSSPRSPRFEVLRAVRKALYPRKKCKNGSKVLPIS